jgi:hypothetical protein
MLDRQGYTWVLSEGEDTFSPEKAREEYPDGPRAALDQNIQEGGLYLHGIVKGRAGSLSDRFAGDGMMPEEAVSDLKKGSVSTGIPKMTITMDTESENSSGPIEGKGGPWTETVGDFVENHAEALRNFLRNLELPKHRHGELQGTAKYLVIEFMEHEEDAAVRRNTRRSKKREKQRSKRKQRCNDGTFAATGGPYDEDEGPAKNPKKPKPSLRVKKKSGVTKTVQRTPQSTSSGVDGTRKTGRQKKDRATLQRQPSTAARRRGRSWRIQDVRRTR